MSHYVFVDPESSVEFLRQVCFSLERQYYVVACVLFVDAVGKSSVAPNISFTGFAACISRFDHWIAFILLAAIGLNMIRESAGGASEEGLVSPLPAGTGYDTMKINRPQARRTATGRAGQVPLGITPKTGRLRRKSRRTTAPTSAATSSIITLRAAVEPTLSLSARRKQTFGGRISITADRPALQLSSGAATPPAGSRAAIPQIRTRKITRASISARTRPVAITATPIPELRPAIHTCASNRGHTRHATKTPISSSATIRMTAT